MAAIPNSDLPPAYCEVMFPSTDIPEVTVVENETETLINDSFEHKNARISFYQKVISIFLLQTLAVDLLLELFQYYRIFDFHFNVAGYLMLSIMLYFVSIALMVEQEQKRRLAPYNYVILVYHPIIVTIILVLGMRTILEGYYPAQNTLELIALAWKSCIFACPAILLYCVFSIDSRHEFKLRNCILIATGIFILTYVCLLPYVSDRYPDGIIGIFYPNIAFYPIYLYILYAIDAMTKSNYHRRITSSDYINGAVDLYFDFFVIIRDYIKSVIALL